NKKYLSILGISVIASISLLFYKFYKQKFLNNNNNIDKIRSLLNKVILKSKYVELISACRTYYVELNSYVTELNNFMNDLNGNNLDIIFSSHLEILKTYKGKFAVAKDDFLN